MGRLLRLGYYALLPAASLSHQVNISDWKTGEKIACSPFHSHQCCLLTSEVGTLPTKSGTGQLWEHLAGAWGTHGGVVNCEIQTCGECKHVWGSGMRVRYEGRASNPCRLRRTATLVPEPAGHRAHEMRGSFGVSGSAQGVSLVDSQPPRAEAPPAFGESWHLPAPCVQVQRHLWLKLAGRFQDVRAGTRDGQTNPHLYPCRLTNQQLVVTTVIFFTGKPGVKDEAQKGNGFSPQLPDAKDFFSSYKVSTFLDAWASGLSIHYILGQGRVAGYTTQTTKWLASHWWNSSHMRNLGLWLCVPQPGSPWEGTVTMLSSKPCCDAPSHCFGRSLCGSTALWGTTSMQRSQWRQAPSEGKP